MIVKQLNIFDLHIQHQHHEFNEQQQETRTSPPATTQADVQKAISSIEEK